jgi:FK506-binding protein 4/5
MSQGETSRLVVKPEYAFGADGNEQLQVPPNATVEYTVTLNEFKKALESWKLNKKDCLEQAKLFKEKGTSFSKQEKIRMALKFYEK